MSVQPYVPWHRASVRHFSPVEIIRCALFHEGSRMTVTTTVDVPDTKMKRRSTLTFCGTCDRSIKDLKWCDRCGRPEGYVSRLRPWQWFLLGLYCQAYVYAIFIR